MNHKITAYTIITLSVMMASCKTLETGGKVVDKERGEVTLSSSGDQRSAIPEGHKDTSITKARERSESYVKEHPKDAAALLSLAQLQLAQSRFSEAEETSRSVLLLDIKNTEAKKVLAQVAIRRGNLDLALIFLSSIGGEQSKDSSILNMLGLIALQKSDNGEAMRLWKKALSLNPGDISARMNMGVMYLKNRLFAQASTQFERILKSAPNHQDARLHLAIIEASRGKNELAIEAYKSILKSEEDNPLALFNLAVAQKNMGLYDDAVDNLKKYVNASSEKSTDTDRAFAMIDEINGIRASKGEKVSDTDLQKLANNLQKKKKQNVKDYSKNNEASSVATKGKAKPTEKPQTAAKESEKPEPQTVSDKEIEALEKQLKAPAH